MSGSRREPDPVDRARLRPTAPGTVGAVTAPDRAPSAARVADVVFRCSAIFGPGVVVVAGDLEAPTRASTARRKPRARRSLSTDGLLAFERLKGEPR